MGAAEDQYLSFVLGQGQYRGQQARWRALSAAARLRPVGLGAGRVAISAGDRLKGQIKCAEGTSVGRGQ